MGQLISRIHKHTKINISTPIKPKSLIDELDEKCWPFGTRYRESKIDKFYPRMTSSSSVGTIEQAQSILIGQPIEEMIHKYWIREIWKDGKYFFVEQDKQLDRCNVHVENNRIIKIDRFG